MKSHHLKTWYQNTNQFLRWRLASSNLNSNQCARASDAPCNSISYYKFLVTMVPPLGIFCSYKSEESPLENLISKYKSISEMKTSILKPRLESMCKSIWCNAIKCSMQLNIILQFLVTMVPSLRFFCSYKFEESPLENLISKYKSIFEMTACILKPRLKSMCKII
jgi:hypothetical protein